MLIMSQYDAACTAIREQRTHHLLKHLLLVLKEILVDGVLGGRDLVSKHDLPKHEERKHIRVAQDAPRMQKLVLSLHRRTPNLAHDRVAPHTSTSLYFSVCRQTSLRSHARPYDDPSPMSQDHSQ